MKMILIILFLGLFSCNDRTKEPEILINGKPAILDCTQLEKLLDGDTCLLIEHMEMKGIALQFCLSHALVKFARETNIKPSARFDSISGYVYDSEIDFNRDLSKYRDFYGCERN